MLLLPAGAVHQRQARGFPWVVCLCAAVSLGIAAAEWWYLSLPGGLQQVTSQLSQGRLYADPQQGLFQWWQMWSHVLYHQGWWQLLPILFLWLSLGISSERQLGSLRLVVLLLLFAPVAASVQLMYRRSEPQYGLGMLLLVVVPALIAYNPRQRLRWWLWYLTPRALGRRLWQSGLLLPLLLWVVWELLRQVAVAQTWLAPLLWLMAAGLTALGSHLLVLTFLGGPRPSGSRMSEIARGRRSLDELETALAAADDEVPEAVLQALCQRCMSEQRRDSARLLATYLALRNPQDPTYHRLREFLDEPAPGPGEGP